MSHTPHELADEFPESRDIMHRLKTGNARYAAIAENYHEVNRAIHRVESGVEAAGDEHLEGLKKQRLGLLDEVAAMIAAEKGVSVG